MADQRQVEATIHQHMPGKNTGILRNQKFHHEKTVILPMQKQRHRSAVQ